VSGFRGGTEENSEHMSNVHLYQFCTVKLTYIYIQGGSNMTGTDLYVNKPHCAAAVRP